MNRTRLGPIDILGITLGVLAILVAAGSVIMIAQQRMFDWRWSWDGGHSAWDKPSFGTGGPVREEKDEQVPGAVTRLEVRNIAGTIEITQGDAASGTAIHYVKSAMFPGGLQNVRVEIERQGGTLVVQEKHDSGFSPNSGTVSFSIQIPRGVKAIEARSVSGSITVKPVEQGMEQNLTTISGSIYASQAGNLEASTTSGEIQFDSAGSRLNARSISGSINGRINALDKGGSAHLSTISGSVTLYVFPGLDAALDLHSLSGRVSCDFPVTISEQRNNRLQGKVGAGSADLEAGTTSGGISIKKL